MKRRNKQTDAEREAAAYSKSQEKLDDKLKEIEQKSKFKTKLHKLRFPTYTKNLVALIVGICLIDLQLTYVLAFMDKIAIAEELSKQLCITILGTAFVYMIRAYFDTKAEKSNECEKVQDKKLKSELNRLVVSKLKSVMQDAGGYDIIKDDDISDDYSADENECSCGDPESFNDDIPDESSNYDIPMEEGEFVDMTIPSESNYTDETN